MNFVMYVGATVSDMAMATSANRRAVSGNDRSWLAVTASATWIQAPGGCDVPVPRLQYWNVASLPASRIAALPTSFTSAKAEA
jgi:hypothetical protein